MDALGGVQYSREFQPTLPTRGATAECTAHAPSLHDFNPRSPHGERRRGGGGWLSGKGISTHAPHTGSDLAGKRGEETSILFQPTLPTRGATKEGTTMNKTILFQPTLPTRGATSSPPPRFLLRHFNPRSPHGERRSGSTNRCSSLPFQPTLPTRGATEATIRELRKRAISTHAPHTGSDVSAGDVRGNREFQPTLPTRGATPV